MLYGYNLAVVNSPAKVRDASTINKILMMVIIFYAVVTTDSRIKIVFMLYPSSSHIRSVNERLINYIRLFYSRHSKDQILFHHIESCGPVYQI